VDAFQNNLGSKRIRHWKEYSTVASSIADPFPMDGERLYRMMSDNNGMAIAVDDEEILRAVKVISTKEGIFMEAASATTLAAAQRLRLDGTIREHDKVILIVTGSGLKDIKIVNSPVGNVPSIRFDHGDFIELVERMDHY
jgi:threonine synthase